MTNIAHACKGTDKHEPTKNNFPLHCLRGTFLFDIKAISRDLDFWGSLSQEAGLPGGETILRVYIHVQVQMGHLHQWKQLYSLKRKYCICHGITKLHKPEPSLCQPTRRPAVGQQMLSRCFTIQSYMQAL